MAAHEPSDSGRYVTWIMSLILGLVVVAGGEYLRARESAETSNRLRIEGLARELSSVEARQALVLGRLDRLERIILERGQILEDLQRQQLRKR